MEYDPASPTDELDECPSSLELSTIPLPRPNNVAVSKDDSDVCNIPLPPASKNVNTEISTHTGLPSTAPKFESVETQGPLKFTMRVSAKSLSGSEVPAESPGIFESSKDVKTEEPKALPKLQAMMKRSKPFQLPVGVLPPKNKLPVTEVKTDLFLPTKENETLGAASDNSKIVQQPVHATNESFDNQPASSVGISGQLAATCAVDKSLIPTNNVGIKATLPTANMLAKTPPIPNLMSLNIQPIHHPVPIVATRNLIHAHATDPTLVQASIPPTAGMQFVNPQKFRSAQMIATPLIANPAVANQSQQSDETPKGKNGRRRLSSHSRKHSRSHRRSRSRRSSEHRRLRRRRSSNSSKSVHRSSRTRHRSRSHQNSRERRRSSTERSHSRSSGKRDSGQKRSVIVEKMTKRELSKKKVIRSRPEVNHKESHSTEVKRSRHHSNSPDRKKREFEKDGHLPSVKKVKSCSKDNQTNDRRLTVKENSDIKREEVDGVQYVQMQKLTSRVSGTLADVYRKTQPKLGYRRPSEQSDSDGDSIGSSSSDSENQSPVSRKNKPTKQELPSDESSSESGSSPDESRHSTCEPKHRSKEDIKQELRECNIKPQKQTSHSLHSSKSVNIDEIPLQPANNTPNYLEVQSVDSDCMELESDADLDTSYLDNPTDGNAENCPVNELIDTVNGFLESLASVRDSFSQTSSESGSINKMSFQPLEEQDQKLCEGADSGQLQYSRDLSILDIQCSENVVECIKPASLTVVSVQSTEPCESKYDLRKRKIKSHVSTNSFLPNTPNQYERLSDCSNLSSIFADYPEAPTPQYTHLLDNDYSLLNSVHLSAYSKPTYPGSGKLLGTSGLRASSLHYEMRQWVCDCSAPTSEELELGILACGPGCINRALNIECGPHCAAGDFCSNRQFQMRLYAPTKPFYAGKDKGWGLMTTDNIERGSFIIEYVGEVIDFSEFRRRIRRYERLGHAHHYFMALESDRFIDAGSKGNWARFVNHSCEPNCVTQKWSVDGEIRIGFFAKEDIPVGQEVTIDYQFVQYGVSEQKCYCGTPACSGVMGATSKHLQEKVRLKDTTVVERRILQLLQLESFRHAEDITLLLQVMVQECLTRYTRLQLLSRLISTEEDACLKLFRQYNGLDMLAAFMYDAEPKDWELKKQILLCLKNIPVSEQKQVQTNSRLMEIVEQWTSNPQHCRPRCILQESCKSADADETGFPLVRLSTDEIHAYPNFNSDETKSASKSAKNNETCSVYTYDKNSLCEPSPSTPGSFSSSGKDNPCVSRTSTLPVYTDECRIFDIQAQASDCGSIPDTLADDTLEIDSISTTDNNELDTSFELCEGKSDKEWIDEIKALACELLEKWSQLPKENYRIPRLERQETEKILHISHPVGSTLISWGSEYKDDQTIPNKSWIQHNTNRYQSNKILRENLESSVGHQIELNSSNNLSLLTKAERRMLFEAQVTAREKHSVSEYSAPTPNDYSQSNLSDDEKDIDHLRQLLLSALLSECGCRKTSPSNLLCNTTQKLKGMPVVSTLLKALPSMLSLLSTSKDSDLFTCLCEELERYSDNDLHSLPPGWKSAADSNGRLYYYNKETNSVQWNKPLINGKSCQEKTLLSEEEYKRLKKQFTNKVGNYIMRLLKPYRLPNCLTGRIDSKEDFLHVTKKLTYCFVSKELKRSNIGCPPMFSLPLQQHIRSTVTRYMTSRGPVYKRKVKISDES
uniref:[histone H3]-lysine(36) N-trimethyltransferase n=1 Tax=Trichobilharzia regenti TaxID=157069 RepID=A0AA85J2L8_TRIRE|nr:unnamed protein product [Trichobilharzia regenti]